MNIYFCLKPEARNTTKAINHIQSISEKRNLDNLSLVGVNCASAQVNLIFQIKLKDIARHGDEECNPAIKEALDTMNLIFLRLFDYQPCYSLAPTQEERDRAVALLESLAPARSETLVPVPLIERTPDARSLV